jgi:capsular polysaccharide export protein
MSSKLASQIKIIFHILNRFIYRKNMDKSVSKKNNKQIDIKVETNEILRHEVQVLLENLEKDPINYKTVNQIVKIFDQLGQVDEAEAVQREYINLVGNDLRAITALISRLCRLWRQSEAIELGNIQVNDRNWNQRFLLKLVRAYIENEGVNAAHEALILIVKKLGISIEDTISYAEVLENQGLFYETKETLIRLQNKYSDDKFIQIETSRRLQRLEVFETTQKIMESGVEVDEIKGIVILLNQVASQSQLRHTPIAFEMKKYGYVPVILEKCALPYVTSCGIPEIDKLQGILDKNRLHLTFDEDSQLTLRREWDIDIENERIEVNGINLFRSVCARIGTKLRSYNFDWNNGLAQAMLKESLYRGDAALSICEYIHEHIASKGLSVRFLGGMTHYSPSAVYKLYCGLHSSTVDMNYVAFVAAYQHYFTNIGNNLSTALSVQNLTKYKNLNLPSRVTRDAFESWMNKVNNKEDIIDEIKNIAKIDRAGKIKNTESEKVQDRVIQHRKNGGKVVCIFGKIMYDIWMDEASGPAHRDIEDWLNHSISSVKDSNTLLLIKPHPNEIKQHISRPNEFFTDIIKTDLNDNSIILGHKWFNMDDIIKMIDLGVIWSGTSVLELQANGLPVMICGSWGIRDHPVSFIVPNNRSHYEELITSRSSFSVNQTDREESALLIKYYSTEEVMIPYEFGVMPYLYGATEVTSWDEVKVSDFIDNGDPHVSMIARRVL